MGGIRTEQEFDPTEVWFGSFFKHSFLTVKRIFSLAQMICLKVLGWGRALSLCT